MNIILPGRSADPTRSRGGIAVAKPYDLEEEIARSKRRIAQGALAPYWDQMAKAGIPMRERAAVGAMAANQSNFWFEPVFANKADSVSVNTVAVDTAFLSQATSGQPWFRGGFFSDTSQAGKIAIVKAKGVMQTTATPTFTWKVSISTSQFTIGTTIGLSTGIVTAATAAAGTYWEMEFFILLTTPGIGAGGATITSGGSIISPGGFASPFMYGMTATAPPTSTWTTTLDGSVSQYLMISLNPGTSNASNNAQIKQLLVMASTN